MLVKDLIRAKRKEKGFTLKELGERIGVSPAAVCRWEKGEPGGMRHDRVKKLAEALGVSPLDLLSPLKEEASPSPAPALSPGELALVEGYRRLDASCRQAVVDLIGVWLARAEARKAEEEEPS